MGHDPKENQTGGGSLATDEGTPDRYRERYGRWPQSLAADNTYGNGELLQWLDDRGITPYIRVKENPLGKSDLDGIEKFTYLPEQNCYVCPEGKQLKYMGINALNRTHLYYSTPKRCRECSQKEQCTRGRYRMIAIHVCEANSRISKRLRRRVIDHDLLARTAMVFMVILAFHLRYQRSAPSMMLEAHRRRTSRPTIAR